LAEAAGSAKDGCAARRAAAAAASQMDFIVVPRGKRRLGRP
jgi:hypothetical protein